MMRRRDFLKGSLFAGLTGLSSPVWTNELRSELPILVAVELSGGNDGLNTVVPYGNDEYYRQRPTIGIRENQVLALDDHFGLNPGMSGFKRLWHNDQLAIVHGCGYDRPSYSHFTSMAYWHTGVPNGGDEYGWLGRVADQMQNKQAEDMLINIGSSQSLAVKSGMHTPLVFDDPQRFQRSYWMNRLDLSSDREPISKNANHSFLRAVDVSARSSAARIRRAWSNYSTSIDYGIAPMDLPKVASCIDAGLDTQLYHVSFRNNAFDTHVQQPNLHRRLLSYASDAIHGFVRDLERLGHAHRVVLMVYSEFGRRVPENANLGTDHGSANNMFLIGDPINGGHYGKWPSLVDLIDSGNLAYTTDFRQVYATVIEDWLKISSGLILKGDFQKLPVFVS
tara:strand:- start:12 stop:1190 length:1179 start_codon:yes stop_codon:yes gene_type:complete